MKIFRLFLISILLFLFCCGEKQEGVVTLSWWQFWTNPEVKPTIVELIEQFERENPNIKVKLTDLTWSDGHEKIVVAFGSGTAPDGCRSFPIKTSCWMLRLKRKGSNQNF
jgi:putative chitobiose transport system substrate-binding protein